MENETQAKKLSPSPSPSPSPNLNNVTKEKQKNSDKKKNKKKYQFEFCKVCKLNHDQGRRHNYLPNHIKSLSSFLSRFQSKLSDIRFFLKNPSFLRPEHASRNRLWCVFCDSDIDEVGSSFACCNAINHLASVNHLKNLKDFLWKYGGGKDRVDSFSISEADLAKWEKKCKSLKSEAASEGSRGLLIGHSNGMRDIRHPIQNYLRLALFYMMLIRILLRAHKWIQIHGV
uniref:Putative TITAN-like protein n=1 Tax=Davidia involucrata TaxID=16924 RepID=A0A5B7B2K1_DAVIN